MHHSLSDFWSKFVARSIEHRGGKPDNLKDGRPKLDRDTAARPRAWPVARAGFSSAGEGALGKNRRPRSLAMWPNPRSAAALCGAARSPEGPRWCASCPGRPASPCYLTLLNLQTHRTSLFNIFGKTNVIFFRLSGKAAFTKLFRPFTVGKYIWYSTERYDGP